MEILTAPLPTNKLLELFKDKSLVFNIDYQNSLLKEEVLISYLGNSNVNCNLINMESISYEEKAEVLNAWIDSRITSEIYNLKDALVNILLDLPNSYFSPEETERFKTENKEILDEIRQFFNSMIIMIPSISNEFKEHILDADIKNGTIKEVDGTDIITPNIYNLTFYPKFIDLFLGTVKEEYPLVFYKEVIKSYFYKDKSFFELLISEETAPNLIAIFNYFFSEEDTQEQT